MILAEHRGKVLLRRFGLDVPSVERHQLSCLVDLGGRAIYDPEACAAIVGAVRRQIRPDTYLFNCFFQLADCGPVAEGIRRALPGEPGQPAGRGSRPSVVVRFKGRGSREAVARLAGHAVLVTDDLDRACRVAVEVGRGRHGDSGR